MFQDVFDGAMIVLAMYTLNLLHPGRLLGSRTEQPKPDTERPTEVPMQELCDRSSDATVNDAVDPSRSAKRFSNLDE